MENNILNKLQIILKELSIYEKSGLDTSSLKIFIKNFKEFLKLNEQPLIFKNELSFDQKLDIINSFLADRQAFPKIVDVIDFANDMLKLDFKDQKESREITISRILGRIKSKPELKDVLKSAVFKIRNDMVHNTENKKSKKEIISAVTFSKWAEIIKNI